MKKRHLVQDFIILGASVVLAVYIVRSGAVDAALAWAGDGVVPGSFLAGLFFTSLFTAAPAAVVLAELARESGLYLVALIGGAGAVAGDYLLFLFVRDRIVADAAYLLHSSRLRRIGHVLKRRRYRRVLPLIGTVLLASPLPDEPAMAFLGFSSINTRAFLLLSFAAHAGGIWVIGMLGRSLV